MPIGIRKNQVYTWALPVLGKRCQWQDIQAAPADAPFAKELRTLLRRHHVVGTVLQVFRGGFLAERYAAGNASLSPTALPVEWNTVFRSASIAKLAAAVLVFRLQTLGLLNVSQDLSDLLGVAVRHPRYPQCPITLGMLLSHTSSIVDSPAYFASFSQETELHTLLQDSATFSSDPPGTRFRYSNLAAGMVGSLLEARFQRSLEDLAQAYLFGPLHIQASFDITTFSPSQLADSYRVLPASKAPAFDAKRKLHSASPLFSPAPQKHYLLAAGNWFVTAEGLASILLACAPPFLDEKSLAQLKTPLGQWPQQDVRMSHGMGLLQVDDRSVSRRILYGHQGFAYGAVNGCFFTEEGDGFVSLNNGASEARIGHLSALNRDLIRLLLP